MDYSTMKKGGKRGYTALAVLLFLVTVGVIFLSYFFSTVTDSEEWFKTMLYSSDKVKNIADIFKAQAWYFMNSGGRNLSGLFLQLILLAGEPAASIINTCVMLILAILITALSQMMTRLKRSFPEQIMCVTAVFALLFGFSSDWKASFIELNGITSYIYPMIFVLLFVLVYMREIPYDCFGSKAPLWGIGCWIIPLALFAGWSNENIGPVVFVFSIVATVYVKKVGHVVNSWMITGSVFSFIGSILCTCTPGNFYKLMDLAEANENANASILKLVYVQFFDLFKASFDYFFVPVLLVIATIAISKGLLQIEVGIEERYMLNIALWSWIIMLLAPVYPARISTGTLIFIIIPLLSMWQKIFEKKGYLRKYAYLVAGFSWLRTMFVLGTFLLYFFGLSI